MNYWEVSLLEKEKKVCLRDRDKELILFLAEYGSITNENVQVLYDSKYYYKNRLASLAKGKMIERQYGSVVLDRNGRSYLIKQGIRFRNINRDETYKKRMERISDLYWKIRACGWYFIPSWRCDVNTFTKRGNRYVGVMSREEKGVNEEFEDFYKRSYIVYYLPKDITPRELRYIDREIERSQRHFKGLIVFTKDIKFMYKPKFEDRDFSESYIIPYDSNAWKVFKLIKDEDFMKYRVIEIFGDKLIKLVSYSFFEDYYYKEDDFYIYIYPLPFANFHIMHYINFVANDYLQANCKSKVICFEPYVEYIRKYLHEDVEVVCVEVE